jgi:hypothetical protein
MYSNANIHTTMISPSANLTTLPRELIDAIIDNLNHDRDTLLACSLVAKPFNPTTRNRLFAKTTVRLDLLRELDELRAATYSTISQCIRDLTIAIDERISSNEVDVQTYIEGVENFDFSGIENLGVSYNTYQYREDEYKRRVGYIYSEKLGRDIFQSVLARVTYLTIGEVTFDTPLAMKTLACGFSTISTLEVGYIKCTKGDISDYNTLIPEITLPSSLKKLSIEDTWRDPDQQDLLRWYLAHNPVPCVHTASFESVQQQSQPLVSQYLRVAGPSIRHLTLGVGWDAGRTSFLIMKINSLFLILPFHQLLAFST